MSSDADSGEPTVTPHARDAAREAVEANREAFETVARECDDPQIARLFGGLPLELLDESEVNDE